MKIKTISSVTFMTVYFKTTNSGDTYLMQQYCGNAFFENFECIRKKKCHDAIFFKYFLSTTDVFSRKRKLIY